MYVMNERVAWNFMKADERAVWIFERFVSYKRDCRGASRHGVARRVDTAVGMSTVELFNIRNKEWRGAFASG